MALSLDPAPAVEFLRQVARSATPAQWLVQVVAVLASLALGWAIAQALHRVVLAAPRLKLGKGGFERVAGALLALLLVGIAEAFLARHQPVRLLNVVKSLLLALVVIRTAVYMLRHILPEGAFLRSAVRVVAWIAWIAVVLHVSGLLPDVIEALNEVGFTLGKDRQRLTLWIALQGLAALAITLTVALWLGRITESRVLGAETMEMSTRIVIAKLVRAGALLIAILVALPLVGIDITALSVFGGALGVGLAFGLQKIASNYVSGFIVLLDRSLRLGDVITVDGRRGQVKAIGARYTVLKSLDGNESIIPNETLITQTVIHHTYSDPAILVAVLVTIAYDSDVDRACELLVEAARRQPRVIADPAPAAWVRQLGASGVDLQLSVWIVDPQAGDASLRSDILRDVLKSFRANGIEIPYPRHDVRLIPPAETRESPGASRT
ncbi:MAG TPA: mechanosensitive ion channel domain-containing protein [Usitatibacter sp.]|nr:mechanosensitive ion channel domain-containing protein [Usitatibacter sp.]